MAIARSLDGDQPVRQATSGRNIGDHLRPYDSFRILGIALPKPELGTKRTCLACGARFYDFGKTADIACPACGAAFDLEQLARARRPRNPVRAVATAKAADVATDEDEVDESAEVEDVDEEDVDDEDIDEEDVDGTDDAEDVDEAEAEDADAPTGDDDEEEEDPLIEDAAELGDDDALGEVIDPKADEDDDQR
jgi:uncharacterized protein (TIGR02300 family)